MTVVIEHLSHSYGGVASLRDVSARAESESVTALLGPNASGKSTLLKCIIGALRPAHGTIAIDGESIRSFTPRQAAMRFAYVPQRSIVSTAFTVRQVVELGRYALPVNYAKVNDAIEQLDLVDVQDRPYPRLSVGQQQRVTLARALAQLEPQGCLVLDEPTSAMDLQHVTACAGLLRKLASRGVTIIVAMHDLSLAAAIADHIWLLESGRLVASGNVQEVLTPPRLQQVFRTPFQWVSQSNGVSRLVPELPHVAQ